MLNYVWLDTQKGKGPNNPMNEHDKDAIGDATFMNSDNVIFWTEIGDKE